MHSWSMMKKSTQKKLSKTLQVRIWEALICQSSGVSAVDATRVLTMTIVREIDKVERAIVIVSTAADLAILQETVENPEEIIEGTVLRQGHIVEAGLILTAGAEVGDAEQGHIAEEGLIAEEGIQDAEKVGDQVEAGHTVEEGTEVEAEIEEIEGEGPIVEDLAVEEDNRTEDHIVEINQQVDEDQIQGIEKGAIQEIENVVKVEENLIAKRGDNHEVKKEVIRDHSKEVGVAKTIKDKGV